MQFDIYLFIGGVMGYTNTYLTGLSQKKLRRTNLK